MCRRRILIKYAQGLNRRCTTDVVAHVAATDANDAADTHAAGIEQCAHVLRARSRCRDDADISGAQVVAETECDAPK